MDFEPLKQKILEVLASNDTVEHKLFTICKLLYESVDYYNWVGYYFRNGEKEELILGPYFGEKNRTYYHSIWKRNMWSGGCIQ